MPTHLIAQLQVTDPDGMNDYVRRVGPTVERFGGRYALSGPVADVLEGAGRSDVAAVITFDDAAQLRRWYHSAEYAPLKALRHRSATSSLTVVDA
ncbi:MAG: DUF1330 domain-containing protein [Solirubrobacteraceae bacterium]